MNKTEILRVLAEETETFTQEWSSHLTRQQLLDTLFWHRFWRDNDPRIWMYGSFWDDSRKYFRVINATRTLNATPRGKLNGVNIQVMAEYPKEEKDWEWDDNFIHRREVTRQSTWEYQEPKWVDIIDCSQPGTYYDSLITYLLPHDTRIALTEKLSTSHYDLYWLMNHLPKWMSPEMARKMREQLTLKGVFHPHTEWRVERVNPLPIHKSLGA